MRKEPYTNSNVEEQVREFVLEFIRTRSLISQHDNVILSEKAFVVNAVLRWCFKQATHKKMTPSLWGKHKRTLAQYIAGVVDIKWADNKFEIVEVTKVEDKKPRKRKPKPRGK